MPRIPADVDRHIREQARNRCGYCLSPQELTPTRLEIEHLIPRARGGSDAESNLWLACPSCNRHKANKTSAIDPETDQIVPLFNPRTQIWTDHFQWSADGLRIIGRTPTGRATVNGLSLNRPLALQVRRRWGLAGWHPPRD